MGFATVDSALNGKRRSDSGGSTGSSSTAAMGNRSEYGATTTTTMSVTSVTSSVYNGIGNGFVSPLATPKTPSSTATPSTSPSTFASMTPVSSRSSSASKKHRPLPLKQRTSSIDTRRDVTSNTISSLLVLLKPREYFITVDHFSIWRRHLAWAMENGKDLRSYMTQRYASNMVFMSLLLSTELGVLFNSAQLNTNVRMQLQLGNHMSVEFWAGFMILVSALLTILGLFSTFTAWAMVNAVDEHNAHCIFRSSIGQYAAELPGRFILFSTYSFLLSFWLFLFLLLPFGVWSLSLLVIGVSLFIHVVAAFSAFGRIIMHTGAMGKNRIFENGFEQSLLPHTLHTNLLNKAKANLAHNTSITRQYRKKQAPIDRIYHSQDELYYHLGHTSSNSSNRGNGNPLQNQRDSFSSSRSSISSTNSTGSNTVVAGNESQYQNHQNNQYQNQNQNQNHNQHHNHHYHNNNNNNNGDSDVETPYRRRSDSLVRFADEEKNGMGLVQDMIKSSSNHVSSPPATRLPKSALSRKSSYGNKNKNKNISNKEDDKMHPTPKTVNIRRPSPPPPPLLTVPPPPPPPPPQQSMPPPLHASSLPPPPQIVTRSRSLTTSIHTTAEQEEITPRSAQSAPQPPKPPLPAPLRSSVAQVSTSSLEQWLVGGSTTTATTDATTASSNNASRKGSPLPFQEVHTKSAPMLLPHKASDLSMDDDDDDHDENHDNRNAHHHQYNPPKPQQQQQRNHHTRNPSLISINVDTRDLSEEERFLMDYGDFESPMVPSSSTGVSPASYYNLPSKFTYEEEEE